MTCRNGYVRAYKDDGDNTFTCKDSKFDKTQAQLVTCAPGCKDLANDILPYRLTSCQYTLYTIHLYTLYTIKINIFQVPIHVSVPLRCGTLEGPLKLKNLYFV